MFREQSNSALLWEPLSNATSWGLQARLANFFQHRGTLYSSGGSTFRGGSDPPENQNLHLHPGKTGLSWSDIGLFLPSEEKHQCDAKSNLTLWYETLAFSTPQLWSNTHDRDVMMSCDLQCPNTPRRTPCKSGRPHHLCGNRGPPAHSCYLCPGNTRNMCSNWQPDISLPQWSHAFNFKQNIPMLICLVHSLVH